VHLVLFVLAFLFLPGAYPRMNKVTYSAVSFLFFVEFLFLFGDSKCM